MKPRYEKLSDELQERILSDRENNVDYNLAFDESEILRRDNSRDRASLWRSATVRDIDKIIHSPFYNRYQDKTQVFSFYKNDDISHRAIHVQLVSLIARNIGSMLGLNLNLIEAIALGHDIGHTPFGHAGERFLNEIYNEKTGRYFSHNIHSARVLDKIYPLNLSLQTLNGIISHNGEFECSEYIPKPMEGFSSFDDEIEKCNLDIKYNKSLMPSTLEGCVVRVCDMIAYLGKDRQDAVRAKILPPDYDFEDTKIGKMNSEIINNLVVNIIENSYGKNYIMLDKEHYDALAAVKKRNFEIIYKNDEIEKQYNETIKPMINSY
ncbi:deoxyguanosinetriphosphate triphosphohydrolase-like protein [Clostridiales bacterium]|nr:deoxyguanosinetriphosphate triphosphohydrolase-like protein [Clostridiales bacterium]